MPPDARRTGAVVLSYHELGPQVAVHELIGYGGISGIITGLRPNKDDDVKFVVYRNIPLESQKMYPVIVGKQDYRYLTMKSINY